MLWWSKKLNSTKGGADFPLVQCQLYFIRQIYFLITCHERVIKMPSIWWCHLFICFFTNELQYAVNLELQLFITCIILERVFYCRQSELSNALSLILFSNECRLRRQSEYSITVTVNRMPLTHIICTCNAQYDPNFNV